MNKSDVELLQRLCTNLKNNETYFDDVHARAKKKDKPWLSGYIEALNLTNMKLSILTDILANRSEK